MEDAAASSVGGFARVQTRAAGRPLQGRVRRIDPFVCKSALVLTDLLLIGGVGAVAWLQLAHSPAGFTADTIGNEVIVVFASLLSVLSFWREGAYRSDVAQFPKARLSALSGAGVLFLGVALGGLATHPTFERQEFLCSVLIFVVAGGALILGRNALWLVLRPRIAPRLAKEPVVILGSAAGALAEILRRSETREVAAVLTGLDASAEQLVRLVRDGIADKVFIVPSADEADAVGPVLAKLAPYPVAVRLVWDITAIGIPLRGISLEAGVPAVHLSEPPLSRGAELIKRAEDIAFALLILLLVGPLMLLIAVAIKLDSPGPVFFRQPRRGLSGSVIDVIKFRTMYAEAEDRLASRQTSRDDPRITRVGAVLRRHSLDELPQLFNVLNGTMSLVGPRPHALGTTAGGIELELGVDSYLTRYRVKPGITGWAQVCGHRGNLDTLQKAVARVEHDLYYAENWSLLFDIWIIIRTIGVVLYDDQAY
jgi:exopolysaccharide biosynthesis polyprenyl glycosylphosphotransferase